MPEQRRGCRITAGKEGFFKTNLIVFRPFFVFVNVVIVVVGVVVVIVVVVIVVVVVDFVVVDVDVVFYYFHFRSFFRDREIFI